MTSGKYISDPLADPASKKNKLITLKPVCTAILWGLLDKFAFVHTAQMQAGKFDFR